MSPRPTVPTIPREDAAKSMNDAIASSRLEGLEPSPESLADAAKVAAGELDDDELVARTLARHKR